MRNFAYLIGDRETGDTVVVKYWSAGEVKQAKVTLTESSD